MRQGFVEHFQNLNPELARVGNHGSVELEDLYHEKVKIPNRLRKHMWRYDRVKMKAQIVANVVPISIVIIQ